MTASQFPFQSGAFTAPVIDYEPPPFDIAVGPLPEVDVAGRAAPELDVADRAAPELDVAGRAAPCAAPTSAALHRSPRRPLAPVERTSSEVAPPPAASDVAPPPAAAAFADAALRRVLEVIDRRRPIAQLRPMLTPPLLDMVFTLSRSAGPAKAAVLRRVRLRTAAVDERESRQPMAAEVFATYSRGQRVRAIAGRIEVNDGRWRLVALQVG